MNGRPSLAGALVVVSLIWLGMLIGVSFFATPVKFLAPSLSLPVALDVGRQTFFWFGRIEIVLGVLTVVAAWSAHRRAAFVAALLAVAAVALQRLWLLPLLDARVEIIIGGGTPPASGWHNVYIVVELIKLALVGAVAAGGLAALGVFGREDRRTREGRDDRGARADKEPA